MAKKAPARKPAPKRARVLAAKKGWDTRRKNARRAERERKQRSDAARKGWETRRARRIRTVRGDQSRRTRRASDDGGSEPSKGRSEFAVSADYRARKRGSSVTIQVAIHGPSNATKEQAEEAVINRINGKRTPGFTVRIVDWRGNEYTGGMIAPDKNESEHWRRFSGPLALAKLDVRPLRKN